jgi:hypothetical protein
MNLRSPESISTRGSVRKRDSRLSGATQTVGDLQVAHFISGGVANLRMS